MLGITEVLDDDVLIATSDYSVDPFEEQKRQKYKAASLALVPGSTKKVSISILGNPGVGKSALALRFCKSDFISYYSPTIEDEYNSTYDLDSKKP